MHIKHKSNTKLTIIYWEGKTNVCRQHGKRNYNFLIPKMSMGTWFQNTHKVRITTSINCWQWRYKRKRMVLHCHSVVCTIVRKRKIKGTTRCRGLTLIRTAKGTSHWWVCCNCSCAMLHLTSRLANVVRQWQGAVM